MIYQNRSDNQNILSKMQHVSIEMNHPNGNFRMDISVIDYHRGDRPSWDIIRECARILMRYSMDEDVQTEAIVNYNGIYAGEVIHWTKRKQLLWYGRNTSRGKEIWI